MRLVYRLGGTVEVRSMEKRVLFVITGLGWGGAESQVIDLARGFQARGWNVMVATLLRHAPRRDVLRHAGIEVRTLGMKRGIPNPWALFRLVRIVREFRPTVVHAHMVHANLLARLARLMVDMPVLITSAHSVHEGARWRYIAYRVTDRLTDLTTNVSHAAVQSSIARGACSPDRIRFMPNGIDLDRFKPDESLRTTTRNVLNVTERFVWVAIGRLEEPKDYPNMLRAFAQVVTHSNNPVLLIVGTGPLENELKSYAGTLGLTDAVRFLGTRTDIPALLSAADAFVMSSAWEGLPIVLLEAAASALPIVATNVGGNAQIVADGESGVIVEPRNSAALGKAMLRIMSLTDQERRNMGALGARMVRETYEISNVVMDWEALYTDILKQKGYAMAVSPETPGSL